VIFKDHRFVVPARVDEEEWCCDKVEQKSSGGDIETG